MRRRTMREVHGYVIGRRPADSTDPADWAYYVEGWLIPPTWTYREASNRYSNKRDAIRLARRVIGPGYTAKVEPYHDPFRSVRPTWTAERKA